MGERSQSTAPANDAENAAAWDDPLFRTGASISSTSDSKRSNAAQLAQELGSSSPWSEAFLPASPRRPPPQHSTTSPEQRERAGNMHNTMAYSQQELGPPPAYSDLPQIHELPASPVHTMSRQSSTAISPSVAAPTPQADPEQNGDLEEQEEEDDDDDRLPLLGRVRSHVRCHVRSRLRGRWNHKGWQPWIHNGKTARQRKCRLLALVIAFSLIASFVVCALIDNFDKVCTSFSTWHKLTVRRTKRDLTLLQAH